MKKKFIHLAMLVIILAFGMTVVGCDTPMQDEGGYTFEFKMEKSSGGIGAAITKIEIINGSSTSDPVLLTETVDIDFGEMSPVYRVSGFTNKNGDEERIFGMNITTESGYTIFRWGSATNGAKIHAWTNGPGVLSLWEGNW